VKMGKKQMKIRGVSCCLLRQSGTERPNARATVDDDFASGQADFKAAGVTADSHVLRCWRWNGTAYAPELNDHLLFGRTHGSLSISCLGEGDKESLHRRRVWPQRIFSVQVGRSYAKGLAGDGRISLGDKVQCAVKRITLR